MSAPPPQPPIGPPANVNIYILPAIQGRGRTSLMIYPRRRGDSQVFHTRQGNNPTPGKSREVMWVASGMVPGQVLHIQEKANSQDKGLFPNQPFTIYPHQPWAASGPTSKGPQHGRDSLWCYEIVLSDAAGEVARLDPEVEVKDDP